MSERNFGRAALVEHFSAIAREKGALWAGHSYIYAQHRAWLCHLLDSKELVPVMYPSVDELKFDMQREFDCEEIGSWGEALVFRGKSGTGCHGIEQIWVKASSRRYREALLIVWAEHMRKASPDLHCAAVKAYADCIEALLAKHLRRKLCDSRRVKLALRLFERLQLHLSALSEDAPRTELMADFDCTLHADHVFSASALRKIPDAWVLLFPVPADANQRFGSIVERNYAKLGVDYGARNISAGLIYKLLASVMPLKGPGASNVIDYIAGQLGGSERAKAILDSVKAFESEHIIRA